MPASFGAQAGPLECFARSLALAKGRLVETLPRGSAIPGATRSAANAAEQRPAGGCEANCERTADGGKSSKLPNPKSLASRHANLGPGGRVVHMQAHAARGACAATPLHWRA